MHYDVLIVGAGPAGCMAARTLVKAGFRILIVEKEKIPSEKPGAGFLPPEAVQLIEEEFPAIPAEYVSHPRDAIGARLLFEDGSTYDMPFSQPGISVSRARLDAFLAAQCGADLLASRHLTDLSVERFLVRADLEADGTTETVEATYLIGADGGDSMILQYLRPEFYRTYAAPNLLGVNLVTAAGRVDWEPGWMGLIVRKGGPAMHRLFVMKDLVALAINHKMQGNWRQELQEVLDLLKSRIGLELHEPSVTAASVTNIMGASARFNLGAGSALLAGEAAGLLDPWGFGVRLALESGRIAAQSLIDSAGQSVTPHLHYRYRMQDLLDQEIRQRRRLGGRVGDLDTSSLVKDSNRAGRHHRRELKRHFF